MGSGTALLALAALLCAPPLPGPRGGGAAAEAAVWTAWLNVSWEDGADRNRSGWEASESGLFGQDSPLRPAAGVLVLPDGHDAFNACSAGTNFSGAPPAGAGGSPGWVALIQRGGGCSFADKIRLAADRGAAAAVIYNYRGTGNEVLPMSHHGEPAAGGLGRSRAPAWRPPPPSPLQGAGSGAGPGVPAVPDPGPGSPAAGESRAAGAGAVRAPPLLSSR